MATTVLAHLANAIPQRENLATEALAYILNRSAAARSEIARELSRHLERALPIAHVGTQVAVGDESRPDLLLRDASGNVLGYVEAKFWAALTAAQPVEYLRRLEEARAGALVFIAPQRRLTTLRAEVVERCRASGLDVDAVENHLRVRNVLISFLSWRRTLDVLSSAVAGDVASASDVQQLAGLVTRFEQEGFHPLTREDIDDLEVPRRVLAFANLVNDIVEAGVATKALNTQKLKASSSVGSTGRYVAFRRAGAFLGLMHWVWIAHGRSPIWLRFEASDWGRADLLRDVLRPWAAEDPPRAFLDDDDRAVRVPLLLPTGVEKPSVLAACLRQLLELDAMMEKAGMPLLSAVPPLEP